MISLGNMFIGIVFCVVCMCTVYMCCEQYTRPTINAAETGPRELSIVREKMSDPLHRLRIDFYHRLIIPL